MKLKQYLEQLSKLFDDHGDLDLCYSIDDEGNVYCRGVFSPEVRMTNELDYNFDSTITLEEFTQEYYNPLCPEDTDNFKKIVLIN